MELGCGGNKCVLSLDLFWWIVPFPDLTWEEATIDEKNLRIKDKKAALGVRLEINEEMYVVEFNFCEYDNDFVIIGFEAEQ